MEDNQIIELFWERNEDAIRETDAAYGRKLHALSNKILHNQQDAEESVSDTYMKAWEIIPPQWPTYFFSFLSSICRNLSFHKLDWNTAAKRNVQIVTLSEEMALCIPDEAQERKATQREIGQILNLFLEDLPRESRLIFMRRYWFMDTITEIAKRYGIGESKVKMQLSRTRKKLRSFLEKEEADL